ncbi:uncharacterized protein LOC124499230 isoform X2 [Dermatophagoides farinae]|uniref:uncharacterized protein LOC124499230 isoform X2 n=1 Tax=Dermatophagoides farinae TaxID=6954 RepID=UPI003F62ADA1
MIQKQLFQIFLMLMFGTNLIFGVKLGNCRNDESHKFYVVKLDNNTVCDSQLCFWPVDYDYHFYYYITIYNDEIDFEAEQIEKIFIMSDSEISYTYNNLFCPSKYDDFNCSMNKSKSYNVNDYIYIDTYFFKPNAIIDVVQTYVYQQNDNWECRESSNQTLLDELNQTHKELIMKEMPDLFMGIIDQKIKFIESLKNQATTLLKNKRYPFFCPEHHNYNEELKQFKLKLKNITDISHKIVDKLNLEPLIEYVDEILQDQSEKLKQMEAGGQFSKIDIIQRLIQSLNSQKNSLKSIDLLNGDFKHAQHLITSTFLLIEELQSLLL